MSKDPQTTMRPSFLTRFVVLFLGMALLLNEQVSAEIQVYDILLPPTDLFVHFADGYLRGPGAQIDLKNLSFTVLDAPADAFAGGPDDDGGDDFNFGTDDSLPRRLDGGVEIEGTMLDVVAFELPASCANSRDGCDWTELGVGAKLDDDTLRWCCSNDAIDLGLCGGGEMYGRLIVTSSFNGLQRSISVPKEGPVRKVLKSPVFDFDRTGRYVVVFANCNEKGRGIMVKGSAVWASEHGYLPGELFGFMYFYTVLLVIYVLLLVWYLCLMRINRDARIPIEKWILLTIVMGTLELAFRTADYFDWNVDGVRSEWLTFAGIFMGVIKHGFSRCLIVMVSMGWGVIRDTLGMQLTKIIILGSIYIGVAAARDFMILFAVEDMQTLSYNEEIELFDLATLFTFVVAAVDVIFIFWILDAMNGTMQYLENMGQSRKLARYNKLRNLFLIAILFATVWAVFSLVDTYDKDGIVREQHEWIVDAATEVNYLFVLVGVAFLWRPNPSAKEYAYVMELPANGDENGNELELTGTVPSAMDDEDEEPLGVFNDGHDERFKIEDGEAA